MPGGMAPLKKPRNPNKLPLALNPTKSKDVLAVLAERNQAIVPVGAWVEPASPNWSGIPAHTSAYIVEEEIKEQQRRKQESLRHFQRQVRQRVNQQVKLRKKQQLHKSYKAAEKEGSIVMRYSDSAYLTSKRTSVFPSNLSAAVGSFRLPTSQVLGDATEDGENQNQLFQQQAQALSQTMKQARHQLASFKTVSEKKTSVFPNGGRKSSPTQEDLGCEKFSVVAVSEERDKLFVSCQQDLLSESKEKVFSKVQKVKFKNPLSVVIKEDEQKQLYPHSLQAALPDTQDDFVQVQNRLPESQSDVIDFQNVELKASRIEPKAPGVDPDTQATGMEFQTTEPEIQDFPKVQTVELDGNTKLEAQDFLPSHQAFLSRDQECLPSCQYQDSLPKDRCVLPNFQNDLPKYQDQHFLPVDQEFLPRNQLALPKEQNHPLKYQKQDLPPKEQFPLPRHQYILPIYQDQRDPHVLPKCQVLDVLSKGQNYLHNYQEQDLQLQNQDIFLKQPSTFMRRETGDEELALESPQYAPPQIQDQVFLREQSQQPSVRTAERWQEALYLRGHDCLPPRQRRDGCSRRQVFEEYQSGLSTEQQALLAFQSGVDREEDKKERQKQYLRHRRLFMDIEREQVKEQNRQKEQKRRIEKIKKRKEEQRYAEEQRLLRMNCPEEPYSEERISDALSQLQLDEMKGARDKQQQREKEYVRYVEALRAQVQEKMKLYNITLPPLCCCGPDFWDAHPDTCANNCIFYKNYRAYNRALHSVINSSDISEGNATLRNAIRNFASAHRRTPKQSLH
ncbi:coiled-coil domain-containing protein 15 isoform X2 [Apodemus sylvaticus]|uniref:coiled-coil domain-containing protein 15 isoform X2 n=1 Tax=Apodemus sylvaticus TaxID=10129 RepID=UPI002244A27D|nr:coiled-coil domain-containing protein 15 isoform X2 [Apodemus sylvaticus]